MKIIFECDMPEDRDQALRLQFADVAWGAIADALQDIRSHQKYDVLTAQELVSKLHRDLYEAMERRDA